MMNTNLKSLACTDCAKTYRKIQKSVDFFYYKIKVIPDDMKFNTSILRNSKKKMVNPILQAWSSEMASCQNLDWKTFSMRKWKKLACPAHA